MHELSIAQGLIELACETAAQQCAPAVSKLSIRVGVLSGVDVHALKFSFDLAAESTACAGAALEIEEAPAVIYCRQCRQQHSLSDRFAISMVCPVCGTPAPDLVSGRQLDFLSMEVLADETACA